MNIEKWENINENTLTSEQIWKKRENEIMTTSYWMMKPFIWTKWLDLNSMSVVFFTKLEIYYYYYYYLFSHLTIFWFEENEMLRHILSFWQSLG